MAGRRQGAGQKGDEERPLLVNEDGAEKAAPGDGLEGSEARVFINSTKAFVGAASFELPWAVMQAGTVGAVVGMVLLALLSRFSLLRLGRCGRMVPRVTKATYPEIGTAAFGRAGKGAAWFGMIAMTVGVCGAYIDFISSTLAALTGLARWKWTIITCCTLAPLSWIKTMRWLAWTSLFGVTAVLLAVAVTTADAAQYSGRIGHQLRHIPLVKVDTYPLFLGNAAFLYLISTAILPLEQSAPEPKPGSALSSPSWSAASAVSFSHPFSWSMVFVTVVNIFFSYFAYLSFGDCDVRSSEGHGSHECTQGNVVDNLTNGVTTTLVKALLCVDLLFTSLVFLFPVSEALDLELLPASIRSTPTGTVARNTIRLVLVVIIGAVTRLVPNFAYLTGLSGGFGNNILAFILPPVFYYKLKYGSGGVSHSGNIAELAGLALSLVFGVGLLVLSTYQYVGLVEQLQKSNSTSD